MRQLILALGLCSLVGCVSAPRAVPAEGQQVAVAQQSGITLMVPRLDYDAYPDETVDIAAAVYVAIENRGAVEIQVSPEDFILGAPGGMGFSPIAPQQLGQISPTAQATMLAGPVVSGVRAVPPPAPAVRGGGFGGGYRGGGFGGGYRGGGFRGGFGYSPYRVPGGYYGPRFGWGAGMGYPWWYGGAYGPYWWGPPVYLRSLQDAIQFALPAGRLAPGARATGFLYFPRRALPAADNGRLMLRWQAREAASRQVVADLLINLDVTTE